MVCNKFYYFGFFTLRNSFRTIFYHFMEQISFILFLKVIFNLRNIRFRNNKKQINQETPFNKNNLL
jgi:hypothetical protein